MDIAYDMEFLEDGQTIDLISIGMVCEDDREYYAVNSEVDWQRVLKHGWLMRHVVPWLPLRNRTTYDRWLAEKAPHEHLPTPRGSLLMLEPANTTVKPLQVIANEVRDFILATNKPDLWGWYCAYDHVRLAQLWGPMARLPEGIPMWTHELKQLAEERGNPDLPVLPGAREHNALDDAREILYRLQWLRCEAA